MTTRLKTACVLMVLLVLCAAGEVRGAGYFEQGKTYYVYKKYDKAKEMFLKAVENYEHGDSYYFLGEIEKLQENYKQAMEYYQKAAILKNTTGKYKKNAYWNLVVIAEMSGDYDYLIKTCQYLWEKMNDDGARKKIETLINKLLWTENKEALAHYKEGVELKSSGKAEDAAGKFKEALAIQSDFLAPKFELGMIAYKNENYREAVRHLSDIAAKIPYYSEVNLILAEIHFKSREYEQAIENYNRALQYGFNSSGTKYLIYTKRGTSSYNLGKYEDAKIDIRDALSINGNALEAHLLLAGINIKLNDLDGALKSLIEASRISGSNPVVLYQIGNIYHKKNDQRHIRYFDRLFDVVMDDKKSINDPYLKAFTLLIREHYEKKNYPRVLEIFPALPRSGMDSGIALMAARSYYFRNRFDKSIEIFEGLSLGMEDRYLLCSAYARSENIDKARSILSSLVQNDEYLQKARKDPRLNKILLLMEKEKQGNEKGTGSGVRVKN